MGRYRKFFLLLFAALSVLWITPELSAQVKNRIRYQWYAGRRYVYLYDVAAFYGMTVSRDGTRYVLSSKYSRLVFNINKRFGSINGTGVTYLFAPVLRRGLPFLSELDFSLVIDPVLRKNVLPRKRIKTIMIDPGHGGKDKGAPGPRGVWEKQVTLSMAKQLQTALRAKGYTVMMTRSTDRYPTLDDRVNMHARTRADLFVSIHCNASVVKSISGIETFAMTPAGAPSSSDTKASFVKGRGNNFDKQNYRLAYEIQRQLVARTGAVDRGVKHARFYVIKNVNCPAVLIETGFLSNLREGSSLLTARRQKATVDAIVAGILCYTAAVK